MDVSNNLLIIKDNYKRNRKSNAIKLPPELNDLLFLNMLSTIKNVIIKIKCYLENFSN